MKARTWELAYCWLVLQVLDAITTAAALSFGGLELNPTMAGNPWHMAFLKAGAGAAAVAAVLVLPGRLERAARAGLVAGIALAGAVVAWNTGVLVVLGVAA